MTEFFKPDNLADALQLLASYGEKAVIVNGGSDIVIDISHGRITPQAIIAIQDMDELKKIYRDDDFIYIGGTVTYKQMESDALCRGVSGMTRAVSHLASPPIRAVGTPAGNICTAAPAADCATMLMALGAQVDLLSLRGERMIPLEKFYRGRGNTVKEADEIVKAIRIPTMKPGEGSGYCRASRRKAQDIGKILAGSFVRIEDGRIAQATISLGALNAVIVRAYSLEEAVAGLKSEEAIRYIKDNFPQEAGLRDSYFRAYKEQVTSAVVARAFARAVQDAVEGGGC